MGDGRRKRKKTGYHPQPSFFLFFFFSIPLALFFYGRPRPPPCPGLFGFLSPPPCPVLAAHFLVALSSAGVDRSTTSSRKKAETVLWAPYCCRAPTQRGSVRTTAFPPPPPVHTHTHTDRAIHSGGIGRGKGVVRSPVPVPRCFPRGGGNGGKSRVLLRIALDQEARVLCFPRTTMPCALPHPLSSVSHALWSSLFPPEWPKDTNGRRISFVLGVCIST